MVHFFGVVGDGDALNGPVDVVGTEKVTRAVSEEETMIAVHHEILRVQGVHHFNQRTELFGNLRIQDGNSASTACRFGSGNVKACFPINDPINQVVIHGDSVVLQIHIVFGYDKLNIAAVEDNEENWVALEMGHLLEPLVAKIFQHRTGYKIYQIKKMFQHPKYPWMLADVDYFVELPDGTTAILEIKTTNYNAKDHWWLDGEETVPVYYETQGRHYMAVMDVDRCFFCCLYGNNEEETIIREIRRDEAYEDEMIFLEQHFWENHVLAKTPPPYTEDGDLVIESVRRHTGPADKDAPVVTFDYSLTAKLMRYLQLQEEKKRAEKDSKEIDADMHRLKGALIAEMGKSCKAICQQDGVNYTVTYNPVRKPTGPWPSIKKHLEF